MHKHINIFICTVHKYVRTCLYILHYRDRLKVLRATHTYRPTYMRTWIWALSLVRCINRRRPYTRTHVHTHTNQCKGCYVRTQHTHVRMHPHGCTHVRPQTHSENVDNVQCTHFFGPICMQQQLWTKWGLLSCWTMQDTQFSGSRSKLDENPANVSTVMVRSSSRWRRPEEDNSITVETLVGLSSTFKLVSENCVYCWNPTQQISH